MDFGTNVAARYSCCMFLYSIQSSAKSRVLDETDAGRSLMNIKNRRSPNTDHCGTPLTTGSWLDFSPSSKTCWVLSDRKDLIHHQVRPVSLTCICCKILEHIVVTSILNHLDAHKILVDCQHGFRAKRSCETQLLTLSHELAENLHKSIQTDLSILDFFKAFDKVPHNKLLMKNFSPFLNTG
jgi:hypothetical protein